MKIQLLCDNADSWIVPYVTAWVKNFNMEGHTASLLHRVEDVADGDVLVLLACEKIFTKLHLNRHNLVVHESALPQGRGWSPLTWQVLEGKSKVIVSLIEATEKVDAGLIYYQTPISLDGTELVEELRAKQAKATLELIQQFMTDFPNVKGEEQAGKESYYPRRKPEHSKLDFNKTIAEQFNLLRVCDNERYPAWFEVNGNKYVIKIYRN